MSIPAKVATDSGPERARKSLSEAIALILEARRADAFRWLPAEAERELVVVE